MLIKILLLLFLLIPSSSFAAKCLLNETWANILADKSSKRISNGKHIIMYDLAKCESQVCKISIYTKIKRKEGNGTCFAFNRSEKGRYIFGSLQDDSIKLKIDGKVKELSLKIKKK